MSLHLVTGVAGQDGILLARRLQAQGHTVIGTARTSDVGDRACYLQGIEIVPLDVRDTDEFARIVATYRPDAVHNTAAISSVGESWSAREVVESVNAIAVEGMLDVLATAGENAPRFIHASSSEIFGAPQQAVIDAGTTINPASPYGESKARAHRAVQRARDNGLSATNLILFGHSSVLHAPNFVLPTVVRQAAEVALGQRQAIELRDPTIARDWGAACDYALAFDAAAQSAPGDFVIATGELHQLKEVAAWALEALGLSGAVGTSAGDRRPADFSGARGDTAAAARGLGWRSTTSLRTLIAQMADVARRRLTSGVEDDLAYLP